MSKDDEIEEGTPPPERKRKHSHEHSHEHGPRTTSLIMSAQQAERLVIAQEDSADKVEAIFEILNSPGLTWKILKSLLDTFNAVMTNITKEGQMKYTAMVMLGLAGLANGAAFSFGAFSSTGSLRCGPGTHEDDGFCLVGKADGSSDAGASLLPE